MQRRCSASTPAGPRRQQALEQSFDATLDPADLRAWLKNLASDANHVGSPHDKANAEFVRDLFRQWGWDAQIEEFDVLYPTLKHHTLELVAPGKFTASLTEPPIAGDPTTALTDGVPPYNEFGADGDVTGDLVYVNYGMPEDYKELARRGIDVRGKIVIARYGEGWRGLKPKLADEHGAIGCIIYSDPHDDGYARGDVYPKGGWRPAAGVQRGSVLDMPLYPGDPLTPGVGATKHAKRLPLDRGPDGAQDPGDADLIRRCAAAAGGAGRPGRARQLARRAAHHLSPRAGPGTGAPGDQLGLGPEAAVRRDRQGARQRVPGAVGGARQSPRRLGVRGLGPAVGARRHARRGQGDRRTC